MNKLPFSFLIVAAIILTIQGCRPPSITRSGNKKIWMLSREATHLTCTASGDGPLNYTWTKNGAPLDVASDTDRYTLIPGVGSLVIQSSSEQDEGIYQCRVSNDCGTALTHKMQLIQSLLEPFPPMSGVRQQRVVLGNNAVLRCNAPRSVPAEQVTWMVLNGENDWNPHFSEVVLDNRTTEDDSGNLYITNVQREDAREGRTYVCFVQNSFMRRFVMGADSALEVFGSVAAPYPVSLMWTSPTYKVEMIGETVVLKCIFAGNPEPSITWDRTDGAMDMSKTTIDHFELIIYDVQESDEGTYICTGQNSVTDNPVVRSFNLRVDAEPQWSSQPADITVEVGEDAMFNCTATGKPEPQVQWFINGVPLQDLPSDPRRHLEGNVLHFSQARVEDSLVVQCNASNIHGYVWADNYLNVHLPGSADLPTM